MENTKGQPPTTNEKLNKYIIDVYMKCHASAYNLCDMKEDGIAELVVMANYKNIMELIIPKYIDMYANNKYNSGDIYNFLNKCLEIIVKHNKLLKKYDLYIQNTKALLEKNI